LFGVGDTNDQVSLCSNVENSLFMASRQWSDLEVWLYEVGSTSVGTFFAIKALGNGYWIKSSLDWWGQWILFFDRMTIEWTLVGVECVSACCDGMATWEIFVDEACSVPAEINIKGTSCVHVEMWLGCKFVEHKDDGT
jgi:hypothetical protein